jgi:RNA polymerase sigma factor (sigma-70 family)
MSWRFNYGEGMDDRESVAAIVAGDLAGLADAYDRYAESLYGYSHWMLHEPADADDAVLDTFVIAAGGLGGLRDPRRLRPWLYAVARNECHRRLRGTEVGLDEAAGDVDLSADASGPPERAELRRLIRAALAALGPSEREVLELGLRHDLHGADLAAVLGVTRHHAHALAARARGQLEKSVGALLVARTGRRACPTLDMMLTTWDGRLTVFARRRICQHVDHCETCDDRRRSTMRPVALFGMAPLAALPPGLRREVMRLCTDDSQETLGYRQEVTLGAGPFGPNGFPEALPPPRRRLVALSRVAAAAGILIAIVSTGIIAVLALGGSHALHSLDAARASGGPGTASAAGNPTAPSATASAGPPASAVPTATAPVTTSQPPAAGPSNSPAKAKPSPSRTATTPAPGTPTPSPSTSRPRPTPTPTATPAATPTGTPTGTASPTFLP